MGALEAIKYERGSLQLLEQRRLPLESVFVDISGPKDCWTAIRDMTVRGAPAIAISAALSVAVELVNAGSGRQFGSAAQAVEHVVSQLDYLVTSRPTAVNLADAAQRLSKLAADAAAQSDATAESVTMAVVEACEAMLRDDVEANRTMGRFGAAAMLSAAQARGRAASGKLRVLTHCNTGSLATAAFGTALGVVRTLHLEGQLEHAYCTETRPYNQGARLTAYELVHDGLPATLLCDSAAAALMASGKVDAVVVGADRIAANGDTANKIGTFSLAVAAHYHNIPFFIAAPTTTVDPHLPDGSGIPIEQRSPEEVTHFRGQRVAAEIEVWNPSFDVTPASLIEGIITEHGMVPRGAANGSAPGPFQAKEFLAKLGLLLPAGAGGKEDGTAEAAVAPSKLATPAGFVALTTDTVRDYVAERAQLAQHVGPAESKDTWTVREVGDGNINFVYIVEGPAGAICIKQALPFVRIVGESWPLTQERVRFEATALMEEARHCPQHVPQVYLYDETMALIAMQYLAPPHVILRHGLTQGAIYPHLAGHIAHFLAATLFKTSLLAVGTDKFRAELSKFQNVEMCRLTEKVIFEDPYYPSPVNHHTSPQLDADAAALYSDVEAKAAISRLKALFCERAQALVHGDLHTGSLMVTNDTTYAIDPEFGYYGPMGFDVGKIIANILLMFLAIDGHSTEESPRVEQRGWLLECAVQIWEKFSEQFLQLWDEQEAKGSPGDAYPATLFGPEAAAGAAALKAAQQTFMGELWQDCVGFMGAVMIRRIVGIAHVAEMKSIQDADVRAICERRALRLGRQLLVDAGSFATIRDVVQAAEKCRHDGSSPCYPL